LAKKVKQHKDSISEFEKGGRKIWWKTNAPKCRFWKNTCPNKWTNLGSQDLVVEVRLYLCRRKPADFGKVMKEVLLKRGWQPMVHCVSRIVKEELKF
jgi:uncharacterized protein YqeY